MNAPGAPRFDSRSGDAELMDVPGLDPLELAETLGQLAVINRFLGGHAATLHGLSRLLPAGRREIEVLDVGSGGGDSARRVVEWAGRRGIAARVHGIDLSAESVAFARRTGAGSPGLEFTTSDLFDLPMTRKYDVVHAALVLHHLSDEMAAAALAKMFALSRFGVVINDLHRHPAAYEAIKWLTALLSKNRLIRHDAPLSVLRAFRRADLQDLARRAGLSAVEISWRWPFRWVMVARK